jgi:hypothetical protein
MKKLIIGFALGLLLTQGAALAQHRHHGHYHHHPGWHMRPHAHGWVLPAVVGGTVVYLATRPQQVITTTNVVIIDGVTYTRQTMLVNGIETEVLVRQ